MRWKRKDFEYFQVLFEQKSVSQAANVLGVRQSSLSKRLALIEEELGGKLFLRTNRGLKVTGLGLKLYENIASIESLWTEGMSQLREDQQELSGHYTLGCHSIVAQHFLSQLFDDIRVNLPKVQLQVELGTSRKVAELVRDGEIDMGVVAFPIPYPNLVIQKLWTEFIGVWSISGKSSKELFYHPEMIEIHSLLKGFKDVNWVAIPDYNLLAQMALKARGMAILPSTFAEDQKLKLVKKLRGSIPISLVYHSGRERTEAFRALIKRIREMNY